MKIREEEKFEFKLLCYKNIHELALSQSNPRNKSSNFDVEDENRLKN